MDPLKDPAILKRADDIFKKHKVDNIFKQIKILGMVIYDEVYRATVEDLAPNTKLAERSLDRWYGDKKKYKGLVRLLQADYKQSGRKMVIGTESYVTDFLDACALAGYYDAAGKYKK